MEHNEEFMIQEREGYDQFKNKRMKKYEVTQILTTKQRLKAILINIISLGFISLMGMTRHLVINYEVVDKVEGLYDNKKSAMRTIRDYKNGLYDNSFF